MLERFDILGAPRGETYARLLAWLGRSGHAAGLGVREPSAISERGVEVLGRLAAFTMADERVSESPGTVLLGHTARPIRFRLEPQSLAVLREAVDDLHGWLQPLPEDLCVWRKDGTLVMGTIAHERDAWLQVEPSEASILSGFLELARPRT
jgi:hypothetical protein